MNFGRHSSGCTTPRGRAAGSAFRVAAAARAFTFMEIMIVLLILGVLIAVTLPRLKGTLGQARLKTAAREIAAVSRMARDYAVLRELPVEVRFDPDKATYQLFLLDRNFEPTKENRERSRTRRRTRQDELTLNDDVAGTRRLPQGINVQSIYTAAPLSDDNGKLPRIIFYADGAASPATVILQDAKDRRMSIEVFRTTGLTRVMAAAPEEEPKTQRRYYGPEERKTRDGRGNAEVAE